MGREREREKEGERGQECSVQRRGESLPVLQVNNRRDNCPGSSSFTRLSL